MSTLIAGRVDFTTGESAPGLRVVAWPPMEPPTSAELALDPPPRSALTDEAGRFWISGLEKGALYTVGAAGLGVYVVGSDNVARVSAGTIDLVVTVGRVYGVHVVIRDEHGERLTTNPALRGRGPNWSQPKGCLQELPQSLPLMDLIGLGEAEHSDQVPDGVILLCLGGAAPPEPASVGGQVAGYDAYHEQIALGPLSAGLPTYVIRVRRLCDGFGKLTVQCFGTGPTVASRTGPKCGRDRVWVEMTPKDEEHRYMGFELDLGAIPWRGATFDQIPMGRYDVRLWTEHRFLSVPFEDQAAQDFEVFAGGNVLQFDVGALGAVELDVRRPDGSAWQRHMNVELYSESWGNIRQVAMFEAPPYTIDALPVGRYRFHVQYPFAAESVGEADGYVTVDGSRVQNVTARP
ncbi:MAG TPA: hypothetical protein VFY71_04705 [Planctomycetota bacterium]|nr:hypothetical protein [Planctomycetota bacterium]